jgi:hypothetical protein
MPTFRHDCRHCVFLGTVTTKDQALGGTTWDLWWCENGVMSSVICRHGDDGPDYTSGMVPERAADPMHFVSEMKRYEHPYCFNVARAVKMGLYTGPYAHMFTDAG